MESILHTLQFEHLLLLVTVVFFLVTCLHVDFLMTHYSHWLLMTEIKGNLYGSIKRVSNINY